MHGFQLFFGGGPFFSGVQLQVQKFKDLRLGVWGFMFRVERGPGQILWLDSNRAAVIYMSHGQNRASFSAPPAVLSVPLIVSGIGECQSQGRRQVPWPSPAPSFQSPLRESG